MEPEIDVLARTIWGEARGEGEQGMTAVASVIANRVAIAKRHVGATGKPHPEFGDGTFAGCCQRHLQFSCWNLNDPNRLKLLAVDTSDSDFVKCLQIANEAIGGSLKDVTKGATHYYERHIPPPRWAVGKSQCATVGNHLFFNDV
jgi:N-acetylmuramoyl-L-alanine amidase